MPEICRKIHNIIYLRINTKEYYEHNTFEHLAYNPNCLHTRSYETYDSI